MKQANRNSHIRGLERSMTENNDVQKLSLSKAVMKKTQIAMTVLLLKTYFLVNTAPTLCNRDIKNITTAMLNQHILLPEN
jgi:hypothetical protein